jgi:xylitol oxidase
MQNWAANVEYSTTDLRRPTSLDELRDVVTGSRRVKALGSRHSFNRVADTDGTLVSLDALDTPVEIDSTAGTVRVGAGTTHAALAAELQRHGLALHNLASLPHISVAGAVQTGTHGSGVRNPALSAGVRAVELVRADGSLETVRRGDDAFGASVVSLGAVGVVTTLELDTVPTFDVEQTIHENLPWAAALEHLDAVLAGAYSLSFFTRYDGDGVDQVWSKHRVGDEAGLDLRDLGAVRADATTHMIPGAETAAVTQQGGVAGPWLERLPHFRFDFTPSAGEEIQSEFLIPAEHAAAAIEGLRGIAHTFADVLMVSEIRTIAPDDAWISPSGGRQSVAFHFTWHRRPDEVLAVLPEIERVLGAFDARPHWGKVSTATHAELRRVFPRLGDFAAHVESVDPEGRFRNPFLSASVLGEPARV